MKNMKTDRLLQVVRWNVIGRKGELLRTFIGGLIGMLFAMSVANGFWFSDEAADYGEVSSMAVVMLICISVIMLKYATGVSFNTKTKTAFLNYAMLPATNLEKYVANWIYVTLVLGGTCIAGLIAGDGVQRIVSEGVYGISSSVTWARPWHIGRCLGDNKFGRDMGRDGFHFRTCLCARSLHSGRHTVPQAPVYLYLRLLVYSRSVCRRYVADRCRMGAQRDS